MSLSTLFSTSNHFQCFLIQLSVFLYANKNIWVWISPLPSPASVIGSTPHTLLCIVLFHWPHSPTDVFRSAKGSPCPVTCPPTPPVGGPVCSTRIYCWIHNLFTWGVLTSLRNPQMPRGRRHQQVNGDKSVILSRVTLHPSFLPEGDLSLLWGLPSPRRRSLWFPQVSEGWKQKESIRT